jgi:Flp pilus assembly protein TadG
MMQQTQLASSERGAVTAEFVMVLPVVVMILGVTLGSLAIQLERMKLVSVAATVSRAVARGEPETKLEILTFGRKVTFKNTAEMICAEVSAELILPALPGMPFSISDTECARRLGL